MRLKPALEKLALEVLAFLAFAAVLLFLPRYVSDFRTRELAIAGMYFIALLGLAILTGYSGQISLGHGAFMAIGGYTTAILSVDHGFRPIWTIPLAGLIAGGSGLLVGVPALRLTGLYLAVVTFGIAVSVPQLLKKFEGFTGGTTGKYGEGLTSQPPFGIDTTSNHWLYYLTAGIALVLLVVAWAIVRGKPGRALQAIRDSEIAAASSGVSLPVYKTFAFAVSAFYAGVAGALYAIANTYVNPETFKVTLSVYLVVGLVVGGLGSLAGLIGGAALVYFLEFHADTAAGWIDRLPAVDIDPRQPGIPSIVFGAVLILVILLLPNGAGGLLKRVLGPLTSRLYTRS
jgi:branched-chain amino acid transport system permease protein